MLRVIWGLSLVTLLCVGCVPKAVIAPGLQASNIGQIAVLPVSYPSGVTRERAEYIRSALYSELKSSGFLVLDRQVVDRLCPDPSCPARAKLASDYMVESFMEINLSSVARNNFVAGFYNTIEGQIRLVDRNGKEQLSLKETESERGGLLFNSGQLLQGLISSAQNTKKDSFSLLAERFARTVVDKLPSQRKVILNSDAVAVAVGKIEVSALKVPIYKVCAEATPNSLVYYISGKIRSNMREVGSGKYCGNYSLEPYLFSDLKPAIEVRSPFGNSVRQEVNLSAIPSVCRLNGLLSVAKSGPQVTLSLMCTATADSSCNGQLQDCANNRFVVYRGEPPTGPFQRLAEFKGRSWTDAKVPSNPTAYEVVAVNGNGVRSQPVSVSTEDQG